MARSSSSSSPAAGRPRRKILKWILLGVAGLVVVLLLVGLGAGLWLRGAMEDSLAQTSGEASLTGLSAPVTVERDELGIPTVRGETREDVARALGFLHGQERFFQMDLQRRRAAGELSELVGEATLPVDRAIRIHRLRSVAQAARDAAPARERRLIEAYGDGVNAGLAALDGPPFEYSVLSSEPSPWLPEDTYLTVLAMYIQLQDPAGSDEVTFSLMEDHLPRPLVDFLVPRGTSWDTPLQGEALEMAPIPGPEVIDLSAGHRLPPSEELRPALRPGEAEGAEAGEEEEVEASEAAESVATLLLGDQLRAVLGERWWNGPAGQEEGPGLLPGSNSWAVAGSRSAHGGAMVANDMHLGLSVPNIWYRAVLEWPGEGGETVRMAGVTLPGTPAVVVGSNGHIAWGFTNSQVDTSDLVELEMVEGGTGGGTSGAEERYRTPDGPEAFERRTETFRVRGGEERTFELLATRWGPVLPAPRRSGPAAGEGQDEAIPGARYAVRWVAQDPAAVDLGILRLETARTVDEAVGIAQTSALPAQNFIVADSGGRIAWTLAGKVPRRAGDYDSRFAASWADGSRGWDGWLAPEDYPQIIDPESGILWSANNRLAGGEALGRVGYGGYDLGARARQIRDGLQALESPDEEDLLAIQLDDRALFLERWRELLLSLLTPEVVEANPRYGPVRELVEDWGGRASPGSAGYRIVRHFRLGLARQVFDALTAACQEADPSCGQYFGRGQYLEGPLWALVEERPAHLLDPRYETWDEQLLAGLDGGLAFILQGGGELEEATWGERNRAQIRHSLSWGIPGIGRWLDMPADPLPGDSNMPRVQSPGFGASERMVVSPGREGSGILHMPTGQSGNPRSPHYDDAHQAWVDGEPTPFLPGEAMETLTLTP